MNIFYLDHDPELAAIYHNDQHVVKMILETVQLLSTVSGRGYKPTHTKHPCTLWLQESSSNYQWAVALLKALHTEWQYRFNHTHNHKAYQTFLDNKLHLIPSSIPRGPMTTPAQAMPVTYRQDDPVQAYRIYYSVAKSDKYTGRDIPHWRLQ